MKLKLTWTFPCAFFEPEMTRSWARRPLWPFFPYRIFSPENFDFAESQFCFLCKNLNFDSIRGRERRAGNLHTFWIGEATEIPAHSYINSWNRRVWLQFNGMDGKRSPKGYFDIRFIGITRGETSVSSTIG